MLASSQIMMNEQTSDALAQKLRENWLLRDQQKSTSENIEQDDSLTNLNWLQSMNLTRISIPGEPLSPPPSLYSSRVIYSHQRHVYHTSLPKSGIGQTRQANKTTELSISSCKRRKSTTIIGKENFSIKDSTNSIVNGSNSSVENGDSLYQFDPSLQVISIDSMLPENRQEYKSNFCAHPPYSYTTLVFMAMENLKKPKTTLSEILNWICENFAFYRKSEPEWQLAVRQCLSFSNCFQRVPKRKEEPCGLGDLWRLNPRLVILCEQLLPLSTSDDHRPKLDSTCDTDSTNCVGRTRTGVGRSNEKTPSLCSSSSPSPFNLPSPDTQNQSNESGYSSFLHHAVSTLPFQHHGLHANPEDVEEDEQFLKAAASANALPVDSNGVFGDSVNSSISKMHLCDINNNMSVSNRLAGNDHNRNSSLTESSILQKTLSSCTKGRIVNGIRKIDPNLLDLTLQHMKPSHMTPSEWWNASQNLTSGTGGHGLAPHNLALTDSMTNFINNAAPPHSAAIGVTGGSGVSGGMMNFKLDVSIGKCSLLEPSPILPTDVDEQPWVDEQLNLDELDSILGLT